MNAAPADIDALDAAVVDGITDAADEIGAEPTDALLAVGQSRDAVEAELKILTRQRQRLETAVRLVAAEYEQVVAAAKTRRDAKTGSLRDDLRQVNQTLAALDAARALMAEAP